MLYVEIVYIILHFTKLQKIDVWKNLRCNFFSFNKFLDARTANQKFAKKAFKDFAQWKNIAAKSSEFSPTAV